MGFMKKEGVNLVDYTLLKRRGLIKSRKEKELPYKIKTGNILDMTSSTALQSQVNSESIASKNESSNSIQSGVMENFGFFDKLDSAASGIQLSESAENANFPSELNALKIKIDDLNYKLEQFSEKISFIEAKLLGFESKI